MPQTIGQVGIEGILNLSKAERQANDFFRRIESRSLKFGGLNAQHFTQPLGKITGQLDEFDKSLKASNARVLAFGASAGIFLGVTRSIKELIKVTLDVEKSIANINVILGLNSGKLAEFKGELFNVAKQTGQSFKEVANAALEFSRQGLGMAETLKRTRDALILTRLTGQDTLASVQSLTAGINSFNKTALDSTMIINKLAAVDAKFAVSAADLSEAIKRVGSTAQDAGVGFDELIALVTAAQQTTARGGAVIGNALKTIFTKIERPQVLEQLENMGIAIKNLGTGESLSAIQVLSNLAKGFDSLSKAEKSQASEMVGGIYQINILKASLSALSKEFGVYDQALTASENATDQAVRRSEELNQTLSALLNKTVANLTQSGSIIGKGALGPLLEKSFKGINTILESINATEASQGVGAKIGKGVIEGLGSYLAGPGLATGLYVVFRLLKNFTVDLLKGFRSVLDLNKQQVAIQQSIFSTIAKTPSALSAVQAGSARVLATEQQVLQTIRAQNSAREQAGFSRTGSIFNAARQTPNAGSKYIRNAVAATSLSSYMGASPGINPSVGARLGNQFVAMGQQQALTARTRFSGASLTGASGTNYAYVGGQYIPRSQAAGFQPWTQTQRMGLENVGGQYVPMGSGFSPVGGRADLNSFRSAAALSESERLRTQQAGYRTQNARNIWTGVSKRGAFNEAEATRTRVNAERTSNLSSRMGGYSNLFFGSLSAQERASITRGVAGANNPTLSNQLLEEQAKRESKQRNVRQGGLFAASFAAPMIGGAVKSAIGDDSTGKRGAGAIAQGIGDTASWTAMGAMFGPYGAGAGAAVGLLSSLPNIFKSFNDVLPDLKRNLEDIKNTVMRENETMAQYLDITERLENFQGSKSDRAILESRRKEMFLQLPDDVRGQVQDWRGRSGSLSELNQMFGGRVASGNNRQSAADFSVMLNRFSKDKSATEQDMSDLLYDSNDSSGMVASVYGTRLSKGGQSYGNDILSNILGQKSTSGQNIMDTLGGLSPNVTSSFARTPKGMLDMMQFGAGQSGNTELIGMVQALQKLDADKLEALFKQFGDTFSSDGIRQYIEANKKDEEIKNSQIKRFQTLNTSLFDTIQNLRSAETSMEGGFINENAIGATSESIRRARTSSRISRMSSFTNASTLRGLEYDSSLGEAAFEQNRDITLANQNFQLNTRRGTSAAFAAYLNSSKDAFGKDNATREERLSSMGGASQFVGDLESAFSGQSPEKTLEYLKSRAKEMETAKQFGVKDTALEEELRMVNSLYENISSELIKQERSIEAAKVKYKEVAEILGIQLNTQEDIEKVQKTLSFGGGLESILSGGTSMSGRVLNARLRAGMGGAIGGQGNLELADIIKSYGGAVPTGMRNDLISSGASTLNRNLLSAGLVLEGTTAKDVISSQVAERYKEPGFHTRQATQEELANLEKQILEDKLAELDAQERILKKMQRIDEEFAKIAFSRGSMSGADYKNSVSANSDAAIQAGTFGAGDLRDSFVSRFAFNAKDHFQALKDEAQELGDTMKSSFKDAFKEFASGSKSAGEALRDIGISIASNLLDKSINYGVDAIAGGASTWLSSFGRQSKASGGMIKRFARGGKVYGGSGFQDDVPAMLSEGEYVVRKSAVSKYGEGMLNSLNNGGVAGYANGGVSMNLNNAFVYDNPTRPMGGHRSIDANLSNFALSDETSPQNARRMSREAGLHQYVSDYTEYVNNNAKIMKQYLKAKQNRLTSAYISAFMGAAGAGMQSTGGGGGGTSMTSMNSSLDTGSSSSFANFAALGGSVAGGRIRKYAMGGGVMGGTTTDNVPALLTGGEYVVNKDSVDRYGVDFFHRLNKGQISRFAEGGFAGQTTVGYSSGGISQGNGNVAEAINKLIEINEVIRDSITGKRENKELTPNKESAKDGGNGTVINVTITNNIQANGDTKSSVNSDVQSQNKNKKDSTEDQNKSQKLGEMMKSVVVQTIIEQKRPGGLLEGA